MSLDKELFDGKTLSDLFAEIYKNTDNKRQQINTFVSKLVLLIRTPEDAAMIGPIIKDFIEVNVKNDEHLVRVAQIAQRIVSVGVKTESLDTLLSEEEKQSLLKDLNAEITTIKKDASELEDTMISITSRVGK
jgi:predicted  nucleic acid-binding Zn-ribbon protein